MEEQAAVPLLNVAFSLLVFGFIYKIRGYLAHLGKCSCAPHFYAKRIKRLEGFYLFINGLFVLVTLGSFFITSKTGKSKLSPGAIRNYMRIMMAYIIVVFTVHCRFVYNVAQFSRQMQSGCGCTDHWEKDLLYIQALINSLPIMVVFVGLFSALFYRMRSSPAL